MTFMLLLIPKLEFENKQKSIINYTIISLFLFISILTIFQYLLKINLNAAGIEKYIGSFGRANATFYIATLLDKYLVLNIIIGFYFLFKKSINQYISIITLLLGTLALAFTFSRTGTIIFIFTIFFVIIYMLFKRKILISLLAALLLFGTYFIPGQDFLFSSVARYFLTIADKTNINFVSTATRWVVKPLIINVNNNEDNSDDNSTEEPSTNKDDDFNNDIIYDQQLVTGIDYSLSSRTYFENIAKYIIAEHQIKGLGIGSYVYLYDNQNAKEYGLASGN